MSERVTVDRSNASYMGNRWWTFEPKSRKPSSWRTRGTVSRSAWDHFAAAVKAEQKAIAARHKAEEALDADFDPNAWGGVAFGWGGNVSQDSKTVSQGEAGRELDALVAEKVMGWEYRPSKHGWWFVTSPEGETTEPLFGCMPTPFDPQTGKRNPTPPWWAMADVPAYSEDIAAAWQVVEKMHERGEMLTLIYCEPRQRDVREWEASFRFSHESAWAPTPALAICRAALLAVSR